MRLLFTSGLVLALLGPARAQLEPPNEAGVTMGHVHLNVRDIEAHKKFWVEQFGATLVQRERMPGVKLPGMLILFRQQRPDGGSEGTVMDHIGLKVRDLADVLKHCRAAGVQVQREFTGSEGFPNAYIIAPDDLKIELQQDTSLSVIAASHHLHYYVGEPLPLRDWYVKTFSLRAGKRGAHLAADVPGMNLSFQPFKIPPTAGTKGRVLDHVGFEVKNLEEFCKKLEASGVKLDAPYRKVPSLGIASAYLTDPVGVYIELTEGLEDHGPMTR
jgi:catechol 2,3-dioxygenase-like lactoylglutathione lyase family enzyme